MKLLYHTLLRTNPLGVPFIGTCQRCGKENQPISAADEVCAYVVEENMSDPYEPLPPLTEEPANHFDNLDGLDREQHVKLQRDKRREVLEPDETAPARKLSAHFDAFEKALATLHKDVRDLIDAIKGVKPV